MGKGFTNHGSITLKNPPVNPIMPMSLLTSYPIRGKNSIYCLSFT